MRRIKELAASAKRFVKRFNKLDRETLAAIYLRGKGIEIGALHSPLVTPSSASVQYVDRFSRDQLREKFPDIPPDKIFRVDIVDDGERLATVVDGTQDFVIANHFLEHCENPIGAFKNFLRVLKPGGILYLAVPDKRFTFDEKRLPTPLQHLLDDEDKGPEISRNAHLMEWLRLVENKTEREAVRTIDKRDNWDVHWHVWTQEGLFELISHLRSRFDFDVEAFLKSESECIFVLKKRM